jgi:hypothetical protein
MYDALRGRYTFSCPLRGETRVALSAFRRLERLPGSAHPAAYRVSFACGCGGEHAGLVSHDELDWAPLGLAVGAFVNLMTSRVDDAAAELGDLAARRIQAGEWPWSFYCFPEGRPRPVFPSAFWLLSGGPRGSVGLAVRCPSCARVSVNLVSASHVDVPFHNDREVGVLECMLGADLEAIVEEFRTELYSSSFDARRISMGETTFPP